MRRSRNVREHREKLLRNRAVTNSERKKQTTQRLLNSKKRSSLKTSNRLAGRRAARRRLKEERNSKPRFFLPSTPIAMPDFLNFHEYRYQSAPINVLHVIESVGMGGAQTMMMELVNGLNSYYGSYINNKVVNLVSRVKNEKLSNGKLYKSYGVVPDQVNHSMLKRVCEKHNTDIVLQHRIAHSKCIRNHLPANTKYILLNHTWNFLHHISNFQSCDLYVSVCNFLDKKTAWPEFVHPSRHLVILNGVENKYLEDIPSEVLSGTFKTGRCHRLIPSKFAVDSVYWMGKKVSRMIPGFKHYLIGSNSSAKSASLTNKNVEYLGTILDRQKKMAIIKSFDVYFYETFQHEGASVAILESLACGVPVICKPFGGNAELVRNNVNGFIAGDRSDFLVRMKWLAEDSVALEDLKHRTRLDFENRLNVKHAACKYMQVFDQVVNK